MHKSTFKSISYINLHVRYSLNCSLDYLHNHLFGFVEGVGDYAYVKAIMFSRLVLKSCNFVPKIRLYRFWI